MNRIKCDKTPTYLYNYYLYNHDLYDGQSGTYIQNSNDAKGNNTVDPQTNNAKGRNKKESTNDLNLSSNSSNSSETSKNQLTQIKADGASYTTAKTDRKTQGKLDPFLALKRLQSVSTSTK
jgi:hypothetical protein